MKTATYIADRSVFIFTWLSITMVSLGFMTLFIKGIKVIF